MVGVTVDAWHNADPQPLIDAAHATGESTDSVRTMLWERWVDQADQRGKDLRGFAVALATTAQATGAAELRVERLGNAATRGGMVG